MKIAPLPADHFSLGLVLDLLARHPPFKTYSLEISAQLVQHHLRHGLSRVLIKQEQVVGYAGGIYIDMPQGEAWLYHDTPFKPARPGQGTAIAITAVIHREAGCTRDEFARFLATLRQEFRGYPLYFGRHQEDGTLRRMRFLPKS